MYRQLAAQELAQLLGLVSHPERIRIIEELVDGELDVTTIFSRLNVSQPSASRHLNLLKSQNLVTERREGRKVYYKLTVRELAVWLVAGLDIIQKKSSKSKSNTRALTAAKEFWSKAQTGK